MANRNSKIKIQNSLPCFGSDFQQRFHHVGTIALPGRGSEAIVYLAIQEV
jgi:hypothetical protein